MRYIIQKHQDLALLTYNLETAFIYTYYLHNRCAGSYKDYLYRDSAVKARDTSLKERLVCTVCVEIHLNPLSSQATFIFRILWILSILEFFHHSLNFKNPLFSYRAMCSNFCPWSNPDLVTKLMGVFSVFINKLMRSGYMLFLYCLESSQSCN